MGLNEDKCISKAKNQLIIKTDNNLSTINLIRVKKRSFFGTFYLLVTPPLVNQLSVYFKGQNSQK